MKTCPSCHKTYDDDSLVFCLDDGTRLMREGVDVNATWNLPPPGPTVASPRQTSPSAQPTITAQPEHFRMSSPSNAAGVERDEPRKSVLPWVFAIVLVLGASGVLIAWMMTRSSSGDTSAKLPTATPSSSVRVPPSPSPTSEPDESPTPRIRPTPTPDRPPPPTPMPTPERPKSAFRILNNISYGGGSRITYYPRASFALCQADCAGNANCRALTWIRPGAYNPGDAAMCYLMASVSGPVTHACCISAIKN